MCTPEQKAMIGERERAAEHAVVSAVWHFSKKFPNLKTMRDWRNVYRLELKTRTGKESADDTSITELLPKKRGCQLFLDEELDKQVQAYLSKFREREREHFSWTSKLLSLLIRGYCSTRNNCCRYKTLLIWLFLAIFFLLLALS